MATKPKKTVKKAVRKAAQKKPAAKKPAAKKVVKKPAVKKAPAKKPAAKKTPAKKAPVKKAAVKKSVAKKVPAKKSVAKKPVAKKPVARKPIAKKPAVKKPAAKKPAAKKAAVKKAATKKAPAKKSVAKAAPVSKPVVPQSSAKLPPPSGLSLADVRAPLKARRKKTKKEPKLTKREIEKYHKALLVLRDQAVDGITFLSGDNLNRSQRDASGDLSGYSLHMADQGTDNYDREFALNLMSSGQDALYEIDEALRRITAGTYGICELTEEPIERARLDALPYARYSVAAQSEMEKGRTRYKPFGPTLGQGS
jgi:RNA polymerase-binding transcription factor DksA